MQSFLLSFSHIIHYQTLNFTTRCESVSAQKKSKNKLYSIPDVIYFVSLKAIKKSRNDGNEWSEKCFKKRLLLFS